MESVAQTALYVSDEDEAKSSEEEEEEGTEKFTRRTENAGVDYGNTQVAIHTCLDCLIRLGGVSGLPETV